MDRLTLVLALLGLVVTPVPGPAIGPGPGIGAGTDTGAGAGLGGGASASGGASAGVRAADPPWVWPTGSRVVERPWEAPDGDYGAGHRGIDVGAPLGTPAVAVDDGVVTFAGSVAGRGVVTIDHGAGLVSTLDSVTPAVTKDERVGQGDVVGAVAVGHCPASAPCLHLGARLDDRYVDPVPYLPAAAWPVLLPDSAWPG